jgi:hypothetical protein
VNNTPIEKDKAYIRSLDRPLFFDKLSERDNPKIKAENIQTWCGETSGHKNRYYLRGIFLVYDLPREDWRPVASVFDVQTAI